MNKDKNIIKLNIVVVDKSKAHPKEEVFPWKYLKQIFISAW